MPSLPANSLFQYQGKTQPVLVPAAGPVVPSFGWFRGWVGITGQYGVGSDNFEVPAIANTTPPVTVTSGWFEPFTDPVRRMRGTPQQIDWLPFTPLISFDYYLPWQDPARRRPPAQQQTLAWAVFNTQLIAFDWYIPFQDPQRRTARQYMDSVVAPFQPAAPAVVSIGWYTSFVDPTRRKSTVQTNNDWLPFTPPISFDYYRPWETPPKNKPSVQQQFLAWSVFNTQLIDFDWYVPFPDVLRSRRFNQQNIDWSPFVAPAPTAVSFDWFRALSNLAASYSVGSNQSDFAAIAGTTPPVVVSMGWYIPFTDPIRRKPFPAQQVDSLQVPVQPTPATLFLGWYVALADPLRQSTRIQQQFLSWSPSTPLGDLGWFAPFPDAMRGIARRQPQVDWVPFTPVPSMDWLVALSNIGGSWSVYSDQADVPVIPGAAPPVVVNMGWFGALNQPTIRPRRDTRDALIYHPRVLPTPTVLVSMAAVETREDSMAMLIKVSGGEVTRDKAVVSIIEIQRIPR